MDFPQQKQRDVSNSLVKKTMDIPIPSQHTPPRSHSHENLIVGMHENCHVREWIGYTMVVVFKFCCCSVVQFWFGVVVVRNLMSDRFLGMEKGGGLLGFAGVKKGYGKLMEIILRGSHVSL